MSDDGWVSCRGASDLLIARGIDISRANETLLQWAADGLVRARARVVEHMRRRQVNTEIPSSMFSEMGRKNFRDWPAGMLSAADRMGSSIRLAGLEFSREDLMEVAPPASEPIPRSIKKPGGRKPAKWWSDFAVELAVYFRHRDVSQGAGTEGLERMIDDILATMGPEDDTIPARTSVQEAVRKVLERLRAAGN